MNIFPTRILLATDGSEEARLAATTAADLAQRTDSELHVVTVGAGVPISATTSPAHFEDVLRENRRQAQELLDQQVKRIEESGGAINERHLREGRAEEEIVELAEELGAGMIVIQAGTFWEARESKDEIVLGQSPSPEKAHYGGRF